MAEAIATETTQYLSFNLGEEVFALDISKVREVLEFTSVTKVPQTPDFMRGVINLRGGVVPVIDLRLKFGLSEVENTVNTCIVIVEADVNGDTIVLGALVDAVQEVFNLDTDQIESAPSIGTQLNTEYLKGMGKSSEGFVLILDIDRIFSLDELSEINVVQHAGSPA